MADLCSIATSWNGYGMSHGTCTVHTWNDGLDYDEGDPAMGYRVDAQLRDVRFRDEDEEQPRRGTRRMGMLRRQAAE